MITGRSLGHTGGTLDKLETIPGFNTQLSLHAVRRHPQTMRRRPRRPNPKLVPADRILYALRDHTGTVESPYLITASIMSKKLAEDLNALVLDVKTGSGAFMPTYKDSKLLAKLMVRPAKPPAPAPSPSSPPWTSPSAASPATGSKSGSASTS